ncbi:hypothetical protein Tco_1038703 [Tanacetum coccineum]
MEFVKKSIEKRAQHKREYDSKVNERQMQLKEGKVDSNKALDASLVVIECSGTKSDKHVTSISLGNYIIHVVDAYIRLVNEKVPFAENAEKCQVSCPLLDPSFDNITTEFSNQSLESENISLKKTVAQLQKDFSRMEAHCVNMELKYHNQTLKDGQHGQILNETGNKAKIKKEIKVLETINIELEHSVAKLLAENEKLHKENEQLKQSYKDLYDSIKKTRFASQVDVNNILSKLVTPHYLPNVRESMFIKPHHVIASGSSRNTSKESYGSNDMAHNYYLEEAKKKTQDKKYES